MKPKDDGQLSLAAIIGAIKGWIKTFNNDTAKLFIGKPKSTPRFPELMHAAVFYGNLEIVKHLESEGCSLTAVPKSLKQESDKLDECAVQYKETPYIILAAIKGHL